MDEEPEDEWDSRYSGFLNAPQAKGTPRRSKGRKKRDEPMKPTTVIRESFITLIRLSIRSPKLRRRTQADPQSTSSSSTLSGKS